LLREATDKFVRRFKKVEERSKGKMKETPLEVLDRIWEEVKKEEKVS
jgi:uncharacterized protein YabN with tetrapyrrole methylase and pyrophosphatase domain